MFVARGGVRVVAGAAGREPGTLTLDMMCLGRTKANQRSSTEYKVIWVGMKTAWRETCITINDKFIARGKTSKFFAKQAARPDNSNFIKDPAPPHEQVKDWVWMSGTLFSAVLAMIVFHFQWEMHPGLTILAVVLAFLFSFLAIQIGAVTDQTPLTAAAKASQLIFGGATSGSGYTILHAQKLNLVAGGLASGGAGVATELTSDFRTGFLVNLPLYAFKAPDPDRV